MQLPRARSTCSPLETPICRRSKSTRVALHLGAVLAFCASVGAQAAPIWDLAGDFSAVVGVASGIGPDGAWAYGTDTQAAAGIQFGAFDLVDNAPTWLGVANPAWVYLSNGNDTIPGIGLGTPSPVAGGVGNVILHPRGLNAYPSVINWTAPAGVTSIDISAAIWQGIFYDPSSDPRPHEIIIIRNGVALFQSDIDHSNNPSNPVQFAASQLAVVQGDVIGALVRPKANGGVGGFHVLDLTVTAVPEPSTFAFLGLGLAGMGWSRRRSRQPNG